MKFCGLWWRPQNSLTLISDIQHNFKKCSLLFGQAEMVFVKVWFLDYFKLEPVTSMNSIWIITFVSHLHVWVMKFKLSLMFFQLPVLTLNNVIWVNLFAVLFDKTQHVVETSTAGYVPVCHEVIGLFIEPENFLLMVSFVNSRAWTQSVRSSISITCNLSLSCCRTWGNNTLQQCLLKSFAFGCWLENNSSYIPSSLI